MCLSRCNFALNWDSDLKEYIGKGYKILPRRGTKFDEWQEATGWHDTLQNARKYGIPYTNADDNKNYHAGFHIFLEEGAAYEYYKYCIDSYSTYEVSFKDVLAFGTNVTNYDYGSKPCIIARHMYVHSGSLRNKNGDLMYVL